MTEQQCCAYMVVRAYSMLSYCKDRGNTLTFGVMTEVTWKQNVYQTVSSVCSDGFVCHCEQQHDRSPSTAQMADSDN